MAKSIDLPRLKYANGEWTATIILPVWAGFQSRLGPYASQNSKRPSQGKVRLRVIAADDDRAPPTDAQRRAYALVVERQEPMRDAVLKAIVKYYPNFREASIDFQLPARTRQTPLPAKFKGVDELKAHVGLASVFILSIAKSGVAYVGYGFGCSWDEEHGLGVATHRGRVLDVGDEDVAFMSDVVAKDVQSAQTSMTPVVPKTLKFEDLNRAVLDGNQPWVKALLAAGASPEKRYLGPGTYSALEMAIDPDRGAILRLLLKHSSGRLPKTLMTKAIRYADKRIVNILKSHGLAAPKGLSGRS